jgi:BNR/Asp-box repeat protein
VLARLVVLAALTATLAGCGGDDEPAETAQTTTPTPNPTSEAPAATPAPPTSGANAFIGSIAVDPKDGTVILGTGLGLFRLEKGAKEAERVTGELQGPDGSGSISSNLVVRYAGPGELIASGHPEGSGGLPENLGIIRSRDAGDTWEPVVEMGVSDYHILQASGKRVVGVKVDETDIQVAADVTGGFQARTPPEMPLDVAYDPQDPKRMVVATEQGTFTSANEGGSWRARDAIATEQLAWLKSEALYRGDPGGIIKVSADGGESWEDVGTVGMSINELAVDAGGALYASVAGGEVKHSTDGGKTWSTLVKLK